MELGLSNASVKKIIRQNMNSALKKPSAELVGAVCQLTEQFIHEVMERAMHVCDQGGRKTISTNHVFEALDLMRFECPKEELRKFLSEFEGNNKKKEWELKAQGLTAEELAAEQERLFSQARPENSQKSKIQVEQDEDEYD